MSHRDAAGKASDKLMCADARHTERVEGKRAESEGEAGRRGNRLASLARALVYSKTPTVLARVESYAATVVVKD